MRTATMVVVLLMLVGAMEVATPNAVVAAPRYNIADLGTLGGDTDAAAVNADGVVVGESAAPYVGDRAFIWTAQGGMRDLGTLGGSQSSAWDINDSGKVVGWTQRAGGGGGDTVFVWQNNVMAAIDVQPSQRPVFINNNSQIVGTRPYLGTERAFLWQGGVTTDLGLLPGAGTSYAYGINNLGQVVGQSASPVLWDNGTITNLGSLGDGYSGGSATGINDVGQIVGFCYRGGGRTHAFLWADGTMTALGDSGWDSKACAVNAYGQIVGYSAPMYGGSRAALWDAGIVYDLNDLIPAELGWTLTGAWDISDSGHIVGSGRVGQVPHAFLLTPVPEPATLSLIALGGLAQMWRRRS